MYQIDVAGIRTAGATNSRASAWPVVSRTVWLLGATSLLTDISSEMVASVLPIYLVLHLGLSPLQFGIIDGLYHGVTALVRLASGVISDRWNRHKSVALFGYGLSAVCKPALLAVGAFWPALASVIVLDRTGKGIRTAPRDAMISLDTPSDRLGVAFGVHRAMDAAGAMLGPLVAFGVLAIVVNGFDAIFVVSAAFAVIGFSVLGLFVSGPRGEIGGPNTRKATCRGIVALVRHPRLGMLIVTGGLLTLATISDAFLYLQLQERVGVSSHLVPLFFVGTSLAYLLLAVPAGRLADRYGRRYVFLAGHALAAVAYAMLLLPAPGIAALLAALVLLGAYYAASDGVLAAMTSAIVEPHLRTTGIALVSTVTSLCRLGASLTFGALWSWYGADLATSFFTCALVASISVSTLMLRSADNPPSDARLA
jgi:MFS family permease